MPTQRNKLEFVLNPDAATQPFRIDEDGTDNQWLDIFRECHIDQRSHFDAGGKFVTCTGKVDVESCKE